MLPKKNLIVLAVFEALVMSSAIIRLVIPGLGIDFESPPQLAWFLGTMLLSGAALAQYVVRGSRLAASAEPAEDGLKQVFTVSVAMLGAAALLSLAGPGSFELLFR